MYKVWNWLIIGISVLCGFASAMYSTYGMAQLLPENLAFHGVIVLGLGYLWFLGSFYLTIILHELGHAFFGWLTGFDLVALGLGNRLLVKTDRGWTWKKTVIVQGAAAQYIGVKRDEDDPRAILMFAGGLIVHLSLILVSVLIGFLTGHWSLPLSQILLNLSLFVLNANPSGMVDGAKIKELCTHPEYSRLVYQALSHTSQIMVDPTAANLSDFVMDLPILPGHLPQIHYLNWTEVLIFQGEYQEAQERLEKLIAASDNDYMVKLAKLVLLEVYLLQGLEEEARALGQDKQVKALLKYPMGNYQVIAALYHQRITEDSKALKKSLAQAKKMLPNSPLLADEQDYYSKLLAEIELESKLL
ncbi:MULTISPECIES: site-2 protease family protein [Streptococcus]|uniref:site-2 protease family protein n=1 Tax=Streptococcus TaxID=1301 RepID=UPI000CF74575|nr:site-2 protease family protein [Streptococcus suis]MBM7312331.1 peptidase M50 [Streptococcus suis]MBM7318318.1 peptidase M50 [Streptococcus suis]MBY4963939.1 peptidase M50 [Streptococcus suis]MCO8241282.1 peptidase M50 [Streptococcus suis]TII10357.1 peptidase M50 [Streptococcus suis]